MCQLSRIDVCIVTRGDCDLTTLISRIKKNIPVNKIIIETSSPLAMARARAIQKVSTPWFAFIDDDILIGKKWFREVSAYAKQPHVGSVCGRTKEIGLGKSWDKAKNTEQFFPKELKMGDWGYTHNTLIKTSLVKDWTPSKLDLSALEDYEITTHIISKGYKWMFVPVSDTWHIKTWSEVWSKAFWTMENGWKIFPRSYMISKMKRYAISLVADLFRVNRPLRARIYSLLQHLACLISIITSPH